jgi:ribonuclease HII
LQAQIKFTWHRAGLIAGVDEVGRGPLAGPVVAAAVILDASRPIRGIRDSKELAPEVRVVLAEKIRARSLAWSVAWADVAEIDTHNILQATFLAMRRALAGLRVRPEHVQIDGNRCPSLAGLGLDCTFESIIGGDATHVPIGAASILAKVFRDALMRGIDGLYPGYGFGMHKGYGTSAHRHALLELGPCPMHRRSFSPVRVALGELSPEEAALEDLPLDEDFVLDELDLLERME